MRKSGPFLVLLALAGMLSGCAPCGNDVSETVISPSGKMKALVFNRNCGATTGLNTQVSIFPASSPLPKEGGNTLILDGAVPLKVEWRSDSVLQLNGLGAAKLYKQEHAVAGVSINYGS